MVQQELLKVIVGLLDEASVEYMITGSMASSAQGLPRSTLDIDLVVALRSSQVQRFLRCFPESDYYVDADSVTSAVLHGGHFNILHSATGTKIDFWMLDDTGFDHSRFSRRSLRSMFGKMMFVSTPEDTILKKLAWCEASGGSEKQFNDAEGVYQLQRDTLDRDYVEHWVDVLKVRPLWERLQSESAPS